MERTPDTLLHAAAAALNPLLLRCALDAGASPMSTGACGRTALMLAIMHGGDHEATLGLVGMLLTTGTPSGINCRATTAGLTALMLAAHLGMPTVVQTLIEAGASVETECAEGETALHKAQTGSDESRASRASIVCMLEAAAAAEVAAASRASTVWLALHSLVRASSASREAPPPCGSEHDGEARRHGLERLQESYPLDDAQVASFRRDRHLRVAGMLPAALLVEVRSRLIALASRATGGRNASVPSTPSPQPRDGAPQEAFDSWWASISEPAVRSWHVQQVWAVDPVVRALVLSPRVGDAVCKLLGCDAVRLYHDNVLSRAPGSKPTRWHCDDGPSGYMILGSPQVVTVWIPLQRTTPTMGSLIFSERLPSHAQSKADPQRPCPDAWDVGRGGGNGVNEQSDEYDAIVSSLLEADGCVPSVATYELGDVSIHLTSCFHRTGPNMAGTPRMILAATLYADMVTARTDVDVSTVTPGISNDWKKFAPGIAPGEPVATRLNPLLPHAAPVPPRASSSVINP